LQILQKFRSDERNFIVLSSEEVVANPLVDISHESLIRQWKMLGDWVEEEADSAQIYRRLADTARLKRKTGKESWFYRDAELQVALKWQVEVKPNRYWATRYDKDYDQTMQFLEESARVAADEQAEKEQQRLERERLLQQQAEQKEKQLVLQRKQLSLARLVGIISVAAFIIAVVFGGYALFQRTRAERNASEALHQKSVADSIAVEADRQRVIADSSAVEADKQRVVAERNAAEAKKQQKIAAQLRAKALTDLHQTKKEYVNVLDANLETKYTEDTWIEAEWVDIPYDGGVKPERLETTHLRKTPISLIIYTATYLHSDTSFGTIVKIIEEVRGMSTGYHCVIQADGSIHSFCRWDRTGLCVTGYNDRSLFIAFNGNFETDPRIAGANADGRYGPTKPTDAQIDAGARMVTLWTFLYSIPVDFEKSILAKKQVSDNSNSPGSQFPYNEFKELVLKYRKLWEKSEAVQKRIEIFKKQPYVMP
jgi:hypothetical protein